MQKTDLNTIKKRLADINETLFFVNVRNTATNSLIEPITGGTLRSHGSLEKYLHTLSQKGIKEVILEPRKHNGSSSTKSGTPVVLKLESSSVDKNTHASANQEPPQIAQPHYGAPLPGLMGGQVGLNQYMEAHSSMRALTKLEQDHAELKMKYESLLTEKEKWKDDCSELKRQNERLEDKIDRKGPLEGLEVKSLLPLLEAFMKPKEAPAGLNAVQKQLSPIKEGVRQTIENEGMPDEIVEKCYIILQHYIAGNEKFVKEFEVLINENNLKKVNDA